MPPAQREHSAVNHELPQSTANSTAPRVPTLTARGERTRAALVKAARTVFERDGYLDARLSDITQEARCSTGTFYTYFDSKREIFAAVLAAAQDEMLHPSIPHLDEHSAAATIELSNRAYFESYRRNARLMGLLEQVAIVDEEFREIRRARSRAFAERNARSIGSLQARGLADPELDPVMASRGLSAMVSRLAYQSFVLGDDVPFEKLVESATRLWVNALRIPHPDRARPRGADADGEPPAPVMLRPEL